MKESSKRRFNKEPKEALSEKPSSIKCDKDIIKLLSIQKLSG